MNNYISLNEWINTKKINESLLYDTDINLLKKILLKKFYDNSFDIELMIESYKNEEYVDLDYEEILNSEDFKKWLEYESEFLLEEARDKLNDIILSNGDIIIWRVLMVSDDWIKKLKSGNLKRIGEYWSWDKNYAEAHWGYNIKDKTNEVLIESVIQEKYVNWIDTLVLNADPSYSDEKEIRLFKNTPLKIKKLWVNNKKIDLTNINNIFKT